MINKIIIYGAGAYGQMAYELIRHNNLQDTVCCFCDINARSIALSKHCISDGKSVMLFEETLEMDLPYVIAVQSEQARQEIAKLLSRHCKKYYNDIFEWADAMDINLLSDELSDDLTQSVSLLQSSIYRLKQNLNPALLFARLPKIKVRISHILPFYFNSIQTIVEYMSRRNDVDLLMIMGCNERENDIPHILSQIRPLGIRYMLYNEYDIEKDAPDIFISNMAHASAPFIAAGGIEKINSCCKYISVIPVSHIMMDNNSHDHEGMNKFYHDTLAGIRYDSLIASPALWRYMSNNFHNVHCLPNPKFDVIYRKMIDKLAVTDERWEKLKGRKTILYAPDHAILDGGILSCLSVDRYFYKICQYFDARKDISLICRPHPVLIEELLRYKIWSESDYIAIRERFDASLNMVWDDSLDHAAAFARSDACITDPICGIIYSYLPTKKPILLPFRDRFNVIDCNPELTEHYYKAYEWNDITRFIEMVARGEDPLFDKRMGTMERFIPKFDGHCGDRIGEFIIEDFLRTRQNKARPAPGGMMV